jgi:hypothetical protein
MFDGFTRWLTFTRDANSGHPVQCRSSGLIASSNRVVLEVIVCFCVFVTGVMGKNFFCPSVRHRVDDRPSDSSGAASFTAHDSSP